MIICAVAGPHQVSASSECGGKETKIECEAATGRAQSPASATSVVPRTMFRMLPWRIVVAPLRTGHACVVDGDGLVRLAVEDVVVAVDRPFPGLENERVRTVATCGPTRSRQPST